MGTLWYRRRSQLNPRNKRKTFLEIGCGSGRSIKYLTENGAKKVYGLDLSPKQIEEATAHNQEEIKQNKVQLIRGSMEEKIKIKPVDFVFSIYAIGWTPEPEKHLKIFTHISNQAGYLFGVGTIPSLLMFSMKTENLSSFTNTMRKIHSYQKWKKRCYANITYRKTSTWFQLLRDVGFEIVEYHEPKPKNLSRGHDDPTNTIQYKS